MDADALAAQVRRLAEAIRRRATDDELRQALLDAARAPVRSVAETGGVQASDRGGRQHL